VYDDCDSEPVNIEWPSDHRRGDEDNYPIIALCDGCANELGSEVGGRSGPLPGQVLSCEECDSKNDYPRGETLTEKVNHPSQGTT
jgi:hypothetical protein